LQFHMLLRGPGNYVLAENFSLPSLIAAISNESLK
jgi:hypothetical protein